MRTTGFHVQHRCLYFNESAVVKCASETSDDRMSDSKHSARLFIADEVCVSLAISGIGVGETMPFVGKRTHGF